MLIKKQFIGFFLLAIIAFAAVNCSINTESSGQYDASVDNSESAQVESSEPNQSPDGQQANDANADTDADKDCVIRLAQSENRPQFECAQVYRIAGRVDYKQTRDSEAELNDIKRLPEALLKADYNEIQTANGSSSDLVFNTLDLIHMEEETHLILEKGLEIEGPTTGTTISTKIELNFGRLAISNANAVVGLDSSDDTTSSLKRSPSEASSASETNKSNNWVRNLWRNARLRLHKLWLALTPSNLLAQPAFANDVLNSPTLRVSTPEAEIDSNGAVYVVKRDERRQKTQVFSLTSEPIKITDRKSGQFTVIGRNQTAVVDSSGLVEDPYEFKLCRFYRVNEGVTKGLAPGDIDFLRQQPRPLQFAYHAARSLTVPLYHSNCQVKCAPKGSGA